jgi:hypothetical protein
MVMCRYLISLRSPTGVVMEISLRSGSNPAQIPNPLAK